MNADRLLTQYDQIADAPDAVARLRRFILDLAVRGKLMLQDPDDEPASELLTRIRAERRRLRLKPAVSHSADVGTSFELPIGWVWSTVGEVCSKTGSGSTPRGGKEVYKNNGIPFLRSQNVYDEGLRVSDVVFIDQATHERMAGTRVIPGDLLLNITGGSIGRCCRFPEDFGEANVSQHVAILRPAISGISDFLHVVILSPYFQEFIFDEQTGAGRGGLPKNRMDNIVVALPPLAEQHRIVAKVDELMALCDQLEAARVEREATRDRLTAATLARLSAPDPDTFADDARFALDALPALTTRPDQIRQLRQTILNLAVRGKLVPQNPDDEPASELLKRIAVEKAHAANESARRKNQIQLSWLQDGEMPFELPTVWAWARFSDIAVIQSNLVDPKGFKTFPHIAPDNIESGTGRLLPFDTIANSGVFSPKHLFGGGCLLYSKIRPALAKVVSVDFEGLCSADMYPIRPFLDRAYLHNYMLAEVFIQQSVDEDNRVAMPKINREALSKILVAVPPVAEQRRIVAKVDELMAICDQLEASLNDADQTRSKLFDALLADALTPVEERATVMAG